jgi:hypothetical protein
MQPVRHILDRRLVLGAITAFSALLAAGPARADGTAPDYPGSTLSVAVTGTLQADHAINIVATGSNVAQTQLGGPALDFGLDLFVVNPAVLPGPCDASENAELTAVTNVPSGGRLLTFEDLNEGASGPFDISTPFEPGGSGTLQVCAYSVYVTDDAAWAQTDVKIAAALQAPRATVRPRVRRSGRTLTCGRGTWSGSPTGFTYRWRVGRGHPGEAQRTPRLHVSSRLHDRTVSCTVTATNAAGSGHATSRAVRLR